MSLVYCDYIAHTIKQHILAVDEDKMLASVSPIKWDLHPEGGYLVTTKKTLEMTDKFGRSYRVTVEEI